MQYLLNEEEYAALNNRIKNLEQTHVSLTQEFCTLVANTMPVKTWLNDGNPTPWGCTLTQEQECNEWYCDECPAQKFCPNPNKHWSK